MKREISTIVVDGKLVAPGAAALPGDGLGVLRGEGVFESFLVVDGKLDENIGAHAERLKRSAALLALPGGQRDLVSDFAELAPHLPKQVQRVRYSLLRGSGKQAVHRLWTAGEPDPVPSEVKVAVSTVRRDPFDPLVGAKTISRAGEQYARRQAEALGAWEALLPTVDGDFAEFTSANLFVYVDGVLLTPPLDRGLLAGTTRARVLAACLAEGLPAAEERIESECIQRADEIYLGNAVVGLVPVSAVIGLVDKLPGASGTFLETVRCAYLGRKKPTV